MTQAFVTGRRWPWLRVRKTAPKTALEPGQRKAFVAHAVGDVFPDRRVRHGPFRGMVFPGERPAGYTWFPKLLGSYEREVHHFVERMCRTEYDAVIDVGAGDGYYAVGFALRIQGATVHAFDTNPAARAALPLMARANGVEERLVVHGECNAEILTALPVGKRGLVFCDCEGFEKKLFTASCAKSLAGHDVFIETHDCFDASITESLKQAFASTHHLQSASSLEDSRKIEIYDYDELAPYSMRERRMLVAERRRSIMEWFFFTPLNTSPS